MARSFFAPVFALLAYILSVLGLYHSDVVANKPVPGPAVVVTPPAVSTEPAVPPPVVKVEQPAPPPPAVPHEGPKAKQDVKGKKKTTNHR